MSRNSKHLGCHALPAEPRHLICIRLRLYKDTYIRKHYTFIVLLSMASSHSGLPSLAGFPLPKNLVLIFIPVQTFISCCAAAYCLAALSRLTAWSWFPKPWGRAVSMSEHYIHDRGHPLPESLPPPIGGSLAWSSHARVAHKCIRSLGCLTTTTITWLPYLCIVSDAKINDTAQGKTSQKCEFYILEGICDLRNVFH